jgi:hypothetical protein
MPWYQPCATRGYSKFYDGTPQGNTMTQAERAAAGIPDDPDRVAQWEVTDEYLNALERAFHQGQFDAGIDNVEDTSSRVFDFLAENCIDNTEAAYRLGRAQTNPDPGGSIDPNYSNPATNTPGVIPDTPIARPAPAPGGDMSAVYGASSTPAGQPLQPTGGGSAGWSPQPAGGLFGPSPLSSNTGYTGSASGVLSPAGGRGINWLLIAAVAAAAWFLLKGDRS